MIGSPYFILLNWRLAAETIACIDSLETAGAIAERIIVIDNDSQDDSVQQLRETFGNRIQIIESKQNLGFAGGCNLGIDLVLAQGAEWLVLINNDTLVAADFLNQIEQGIAQNPDCQIMAPLIFYYDDPQRIWSLGDRALGNTLITRSLWRNQMAPADLPNFIAVDFLNACCICVQRTVFETIGKLDAAFFMYAEDVDFCIRARQAGFQLGCWTPARIWHKVSLSSGATNPQTRYWKIYNQIQVYRRYATPGQRVVLFLFTLFRILFLMVNDLRTGQPTLARRTFTAWSKGWISDKY